MEGEISVLLEEERKKLLHLLRELHTQSCRQKEFILQATPEQIEEFSSLKRNRLTALKEVMAELQKRIIQMRDTQYLPQEIFDDFILDLNKEAQPLIKEILERESQDEALLLKIKDTVAFEIRKIEEMRRRLEDIKISYILDKGPLLEQEA